MDDTDLEDVLKAVRQLVRERVVPHEVTIDETDEMPAGLREQAAAMGLFGFALPEQYGGLGLTMEQEARLVVELGYTTPAFRSMFGTNNGIAGHVLLEGATDEQKAEFLPKIASGDWIASFALTEDGAGSDPAGLTTSVRRDGAGYMIDGSKRYITNAPVADVFMVFARHADGPAQGKISVFLVPASTEGITLGPRDDKMGQHGAWTSELYFDGVRVAESTLIGAEGQGYRTAMKCLAHGRIHIAALCVGMAERLVEETADYAVGREMGGRAIADYQLIQGLVADSVTDLHAARALVMDAARRFDSGEDRRIGPSTAKYFASEAVGRVADRAVQVFGGSGYIRGISVERFYRDARLFRIYEGTSQIQQIIIAKETFAKRRAAH